MPTSTKSQGFIQIEATFNKSIGKKIDTFTRALKLSFTDFYLPGNGGLDIKGIRRYDSSKADVTYANALNFTSVTRMGGDWDMHFGKITAESQSQICQQAYQNNGAIGGASYSVKAATLEMPNGEAHELLDASLIGVWRMFTNYWKVDCANSSNSKIIVKNTEGSTLEFTSFRPSNLKTVYYLTKIYDANNNTINYVYEASAPQVQDSTPKINAINASDGRYVYFNYIKTTFQEDYDGGYIFYWDDFKLSSINSNGNITQYNLQYLSQPGVSPTKKNLRAVTYFNAEKQDFLYTNLNSYGLIVLSSVTGEYGGRVDYQYTPENGTSLPSCISNFGISKKTIGSAQWNFLSPQYTLSNGFYSQITTVSGPDGIKKYTHIGFPGSLPIGYAWRIGLLTEKQEGQYIERYEWGANKISNLGYNANCVWLCW